MHHTFATQSCSTVMPWNIYEHWSLYTSASCLLKLKRAPYSCKNKQMLKCLQEQVLISVHGYWTDSLHRDELQSIKWLTTVTHTAGKCIHSRKINLSSVSCGLIGDMWNLNSLEIYCIIEQCLQVFYSNDLLSYLV